MKTIVDKCIEWNAARYDQLLDIDLASKLLAEEINETFATNDTIEVLDGVGDIVFVAIGVLWKAGIDQDVINEIFGYDTTAPNTPLGPFNLANVPLTRWLNVSSYATTDLVSEVDTVEQAMAVTMAMNSLTIALVRLTEYGFQHKFYEVVDAICDSNNTKALPSSKVDPSVKANVDKGQSFVPPTAALLAIKNSAN